MHTTELPLNQCMTSQEICVALASLYQSYSMADEWESVSPTGFD